MSEDLVALRILAKQIMLASKDMEEALENLHRELFNKMTVVVGPHDCVTFTERKPIDK